MNVTIVILMLLQSVVTLGLVYLMMRSFHQMNGSLLRTFQEQLESIKREKIEERKIEGLRVLLPLRVQASERLVLFLERMQPAQLVARHLTQGIEAGELAHHILQNIRDEFDHNLSQQLYIGPIAWQLTKTAREEMVQMVLQAQSTLPEQATAIDLATQIMSSDMKMIDVAINRIREDMEKYTA